MDTIVAFFQKPLKWYFIVVCGIVFVLFDFLYSFAVSALFAALHANLPVVPGATDIVTTPLWQEIPLLLLGTFTEEGIFRFPLVFPIIFWGLSKKSFFCALAIGVILSAVFGYLHGGFVHIALQGMDGFFFCLLFLKFGAFQKRYVKGLFSVWMIHAAFDISILLIVHFFVQF